MPNINGTMLSHWDRVGNVLHGKDCEGIATLTASTWLTHQPCMLHLPCRISQTLAPPTGALPEILTPPVIPRAKQTPTRSNVMSISCQEQQTRRESSDDAFVAMASCNTCMDDRLYSIDATVIKQTACTCAVHMCRLVTAYGHVICLSMLSLVHVTSVRRL